MAIAPFYLPTVRGTLQPEHPATDMMQCEVCSASFVPDENTFGCPHCAQARYLEDQRTGK